VADAEDDGPGMWQSPVSSIKLLQLNRVITDEYCAHADCSGSDGAGFSVDYQLPVDIRFPLAPVTLQFEYVAIFIFSFTDKRYLCLFYSSSSS